MHSNPNPLTPRIAAGLSLSEHDLIAALLGGGVIRSQAAPVDATDPIRRECSAWRGPGAFCGISPHAMIAHALAAGQRVMRLAVAVRQSLSPDAVRKKAGAFPC
jgi:hypothetical protein